MKNVKVEIGSSSTVMMTPDEARAALRAHLAGNAPVHHMRIESLKLDDEAWSFEIVLPSGKKATILLPEIEFDEITIKLC